MVSAIVLRNIVGTIGNITAFFLFASPIPTFIKIWKSKSVEEFKPDPYLATVMNCMTWVFYGLPIVDPDNTLVATINGAGLAMELIYVAIFFIYTNKKGRVKVISWLFIEFAFMAIVVACALLLRHTHEQRSTVVGIFGVVFTALMGVSPLTVMRKVIKTKSVKHMPFYLSLATFVNALIWVTYGWIRFQVYILVANGLGAIFGAIQLILYGCYFKSTPKDDVVKQSGMQLAMQNA
ncbi:MtN3_slv domain-containing protein [Cephalotus follicularis]|uniref:Bidirectional sugar transporter SWEET n=1 Tax=Cephalotus follicularis TaxID=3775 RepID=A0A1Q3BXH7_CEPFO|nr:MtN3_slv domain-containing protein [Cephalotus follicularis]